MTTSWPNGTARRAAGMAMIAAPVFLLLYGLMGLLGGEPGPGIGWTMGHLLFLVGMLLYVLVVAELRRQAHTTGWRIWAANVTTAIAWLGLAAFLVQIFLDLTVGLQSANRAAMSAAFDRVQAIPGVELTVYILGPILFSVAMVVFAALLAVGRRIAVASAVLISMGSLLPAISVGLIPVAAICVLAGLAPLGVRLLRTDAVTPRAALR